LLYYSEPVTPILPLHYALPLYSSGLDHHLSS
jgi:hypothetical protein